MIFYVIENVIIVIGSQYCDLELCFVLLHEMHIFLN